MTYRCGVGPGIPGIPPGEPHLRCDNCGRVLVVVTMLPPAWLRDNKPPKGWAMAVRDNGTRMDACPHCVEKAKVSV